MESPIPLGPNRLTSILVPVVDKGVSKVCYQKVFILYSRSDVCLNLIFWMWKCEMCFVIGNNQRGWTALQMHEVLQRHYLD